MEINYCNDARLIDLLTELQFNKSDSTVVEKKEDA